MFFEDMKCCVKHLSEFVLKCSPDSEGVDPLASIRH